MDTEMTKARTWPNEAKEARDCAAEKAAEILRRARTLATSGDPNVLRQVLMIIDLASGILRWLEHEGACTRPE